MTANGKLLSLIDYTGLSIRDAAEVIGCSEQTLSRKLAGKDRYTSTDADIAAISGIADWQDRQVAALASRINRIKSENGTSGEIRIIQYRTNADLLPGVPPASAGRMVIARIARANPDMVMPVIFDRKKYDIWRGGLADTAETRAEWAGGFQSWRLGMKIDHPHNGSASLGYAAIRMNEAASKIGSGEDQI